MALTEAASAVPQVVQTTSNVASMVPAWLSFLGSIALGAISGFGTAWVKMARYQQKCDDLIEEKNRHQAKIDALRTDMDKMLEFKESTQKFVDSKIYTSHSPLSLSEYGKKLIKESGFESLFPSVRDDLVARLEKMQPKTQYDVQEMARALMDSLTEYSALGQLKTYAFQNGVDFQQILRAGAIPLRDFYLEKHPEIKE